VDVVVRDEDFADDIIVHELSFFAQSRAKIAVVRGLDGGS
jgi:hypothetical protein